MATSAQVRPGEWLQRIHEAKRIHFHEDRVLLWRRCAQLYRSGDCSSRLKSAYLSEVADGVEAQQLVINITQAIVENFVASVYPAEVIPSVLPKRPGDDDSAFAVQTYLQNRVIREAGLDVASERTTLHAAIFGDGFTKVGYTAIPRRRASSDPEDILDTSDVEIQALGDLEFTDESSFRGQLPWFLAVYPWCVVPAPGASSLRDAPWVVHRIRKRFEDVVNNPNYDDRARASLSPVIDRELSEEEHPFKDMEMLTVRGDEKEAQGPDYIDLFEVWDWYNQEFRVIAAGNPDLYLKTADWPAQGLEGYPFVHLGFKPDPESFFHNPIIGDFADLQQELNITSSFMLEAFKRSVPVNVYNKNNVDDTEINKLADSSVGAFVGIDGAPSPENIDTFPKGSSFSPDLYGVRNSIIQAIMLVTGQSDFLIGQSQKTKSATEVAASAHGYSSRVGQKKKILSRYLRDLLRKAYQVTRHRLDTDEWIRSVGPKGANMIHLSPSDVQKEYDVDIDAEIFDNRVGDPVRMKIVTDAMAPLMNPEIAMAFGFNLVELGKKYLRAVGEKDLDKLQPAGADPKDPEIENQVMLEGMTVEPHPHDDDIQHLESHIEAQKAAPQGRHIVFQDHIRKHAQNLEMKMRLTQEQQAGGGPVNTGANDAPSRNSAASDNGNMQARVLQGGNNQ